ncbi:MAG: hypothetical protein QOG58_6307, partial [Caballeronia sp.]|nr:hypothetical protein [Caballeronia sp.]
MSGWSLRMHRPNLTRAYPRLPARKSALKHTRETRTQHDPLRLARFASLLWVIALGHCFGSLLWVIALGHCFGS